MSFNSTMKIVTKQVGLPSIMSALDFLGGQKNQRASKPTSENHHSGREKLIGKTSVETRHKIKPHRSLRQVVKVSGTDDRENSVLQPYHGRKRLEHFIGSLQSTYHYQSVVQACDSLERFFFYKEYENPALQEQFIDGTGYHLAEERTGLPVGISVFTDGEGSEHFFLHGKQFAEGGSKLVFDAFEWSSGEICVRYKNKIPARELANEAALDLKQEIDRMIRFKQQSYIEFPGPLFCASYFDRSQGSVLRTEAFVPKADCSLFDLIAGRSITIDEFIQLADSLIDQQIVFHDLLKVTHGDIKLENIYLKGDLIFFGDFGAMSENHPITTLEGTAADMAPAEIIGFCVKGRHDFRDGVAADIFALGCVFEAMIRRQESASQEMMNNLLMKSQSWCDCQPELLLAINRQLAEEKYRLEEMNGTPLEMAINRLIAKMKDPDCESRATDRDVKDAIQEFKLMKKIEEIGFNGKSNK